MVTSCQIFDKGKVIIVKWHTTVSIFVAVNH